MPHLTFWNRYWRVAGDEFSVPAFCSILVRIFWTCLVVVVFIVTYNTLKDCKSDGWIFILYLAFSIAIFVATIICDTAVLLVSLRGSITETYQRSSLGFYLNIKLFLGAMQFICAVFGLISLTAQSGIPCNQSFEQSRITKAFIFIIVISQLVDVLSLICCCYLFSANKIDEEEYEDEDDDGGYDVEAVATRTGTADKEGRSSGNISSSSTSGATYKKKRRKRTKHQEPKDESWAINTWENRCRRITRSIQICSCNIFGGGNITEGFDDVAKVLTDFFHHDGFLDVVPSDVVAGIVLVRMEQRSVRKARNHQQSVGIDGMSSQQQEPAMDVEAGDDHSRKDVVSSRDIAVEDDPEEDSNSTSNSSNNSNSSPHAPLNRTSFEINRSRNSGAQKTSSHSNRNNGGTAAAADHFAERRIPRSGISSSEFALGAAEEGTTTANAPPSGSSRVLIPVEELESIARCSVFALAIYTHLIVIYMQPCTGLCRLCASGFCNSAGAAAAQSSSSCCCLPAIVRSPSSSSSSSLLPISPASSPSLFEISSITRSDTSSIVGLVKMMVGLILTPNVLESLEDISVVAREERPRSMRDASVATLLTFAISFTIPVIMDFTSSSVYFFVGPREREEEEEDELLLLAVEPPDPLFLVSSSRSSHWCTTFNFLSKKSLQH
mmetsp:Transcript_7415/g.12465  ORF Transcript_7415/g.12465 Transcript_7415/m.12465 type:complete len:666 (+) Transcript_7415:169-2166(+)